MLTSTTHHMAKKVKPSYVKEGTFDIDLYEITSGDSCNNYHIYMETPVFTPDSKKFIYLRTVNGTHIDRNQDYTQIMLCDIEDNFSVRQLTDEHRVCAVCMSLDGKYTYYIVEEGKTGSSKIFFKRIDMSTLRRETVMVIDKPLYECHSVPSIIYPLGTISADGSRFVTASFLGDGVMQNSPWGVLCFDIQKATARVVIQGEDYCNVHPQYNPCLENSHELLIQHNHGCFCDENGNIKTLVSGHGADIHVVNDDGINMRSFPWGRNGAEQCQGHQCWRGTRNTAVTGTFSSVLTGRADQTTSLSNTYVESECHLIESAPISVQPSRLHMGIQNKGGYRNVLTRNFKNPHFVHFSFDPTGKYFVSDCLLENEPNGEKSELVIGTLGEGSDATLNVKSLIYPQTSWKDQQAHPHPFFSPDHKYLLFNSDVNGLSQIYLAKNLGL